MNSQETFQFIVNQQLSILNQKKWEYLRHIGIALNHKCDFALVCEKEVEITIRVPKKFKKEKKIVEQRQCIAYVQNGDQCSRFLKNKQIHYCGLHKSQPFGNINLGYIKKM